MTLFPSAHECGVAAIDSSTMTLDPAHVSVRSRMRSGRHLDGRGEALRIRFRPLTNAEWPPSY